MVVDILQWTYRKFKVYCFIAYILLAVCLLGYSALILYWLQNMMHALKVRKRHPASPRPEQLTASPARVLTTEPLPDEIMELDDRPAPKVRIRKIKRPPRRLEAKKASLTPSPLNQRARGRRKRRPRRSSQISDFDSEDAVGKKLPHFRRRLKLPRFGVATPRPSRHRGPEESSQSDGANSTNTEIISHIERGIDKITQKMDNVIRALDNSCEISDVKKQISNVEEMIPELKHWLEVGCSKPDKDLKQQAERVLPPLEDLRTLLVKLSEMEKKTKDRQKQREKDTPKVFRLQSDLESEKLKVQKLRESLSSVGLTIDEAMDANNILDSMATSPRFLKAVRDRLAAREKSSNPSKRKLTLDDLLTWTDMPTGNGDETKPYSELDTSLQASADEGFLQVLNTQLNAKYDVLTQRQKVLNHNLRVAEEEKRILQFQLDKVESNISQLKVKLADLSKDWKMLDDFRGLAETYKKQK